MQQLCRWDGRARAATAIRDAFRRSRHAQLRQRRAALVACSRRCPRCPALQMIEDAGFRGVDYENLTFGVVAIHSGFKL